MLKFPVGQGLKHIKTNNEYVVVSHVFQEATLAAAYCYKTIEDVPNPILWIRDAVEMEDGRFAPVALPSTQPVVVIDKISVRINNEDVVLQCVGKSGTVAPVYYAWVSNFIDPDDIDSDDFQIIMQEAPAVGPLVGTWLCSLTGLFDETTVYGDTPQEAVDKAIRLTLQEQQKALDEARSLVDLEEGHLARLMNRFGNP